MKMMTVTVYALVSGKFGKIKGEKKSKRLGGTEGICPLLPLSTYFREMKPYVHTKTCS
jgi:hypothetical protein